MKISILGNTYHIKDSVWKKHLQMHPVRPLEALKSNVRMALNSDSLDDEKIEAVIMDEYRVYANINVIISRAEQKYKERR